MLAGAGALNRLVSDRTPGFKTERNRVKAPPFRRTQGEIRAQLSVGYDRRFSCVQWNKFTGELLDATGRFPGGKRGGRGQ